MRRFIFRKLRLSTQGIPRSKEPEINLDTPTKRELDLIEEFRTKLKELPVVQPTPSIPRAEMKWITRKNEFRTKVLIEDPRAFLSWDVIRYNMGHGDLEPFKYHLDQFKDKLICLDNIIEFGGGFGAMCRVVYEQGFKGQYTIFDLPEFLLLQEFYLKLHNVDISNIFFVSDIKNVGTQDGLLIATWSLSEVGLALRMKFLSAINPQYFLIAYQPSFGGIDNSKYFKNLAANYPSLEWADMPIEIFPNNRYLFGFPKTPTR